MNFNNAQFEKSFGCANELPISDIGEICFSGRSNVGKSSLVNKILGRKAIARVSSRPGKTITVNFFKVENIRLVDLPGYGYAKVAYSEKERWSELMESYFDGSRNIKNVFQLIDMRHPATEFDISMLRFLKDAGISYTIVLTKSDKLNVSETKNRLEQIEEELSDLADNVQIIPFSAQNGQGTEQIRQIIEGFNF